MSAVITLTTDFGLADAYVAAMKGVILGINPEAKLVDICHSVRPQDVAHGAFLLGTAHRFFPQDTVHLAVIDPGVGTSRRAIILKTPSACFVAPDNGLLSYVLEAAGVETSPGGGSTALVPGLEAFDISRREFWRSPVSPTFHGRDVFAPVAAHLSLGVPPAEFGAPVSSLVTLPLTRPERAADGSLVGHVRHIDAFGNLITDVAEQALPPDRGAITIHVGGRSIAGLSHTYACAEVGGLVALIGSSGHLEVSRNGGSARELLGARVGDEVTVRQPGGGEP
jgi:hypothetical protein